MALTALEHEIGDLNEPPQPATGHPLAEEFVDFTLIEKDDLVESLICHILHATVHTISKTDHRQRPCQQRKTETEREARQVRPPGDRRIYGAESGIKQLQGEPGTDDQ